MSMNRKGAKTASKEELYLVCAYLLVPDKTLLSWGIYTFRYCIAVQNIKGAEIDENTLKG